MLKSIFRNLAPRKPAPAAAASAESGYFDHLMARYFSSLGKIQEDNYDYERFGVAPGTHVDADPQMSFLWFQLMRKNIGKIEQVRQLFEDNTSRQLYEDLILYRLLGHPYMRLPSNNAQHWAMREAAHGYQCGSSTLGGFSRPLDRFRIEFDGEPIDLQCWPANIAWSFLLRQYYFERDGVRAQVAPGDIVIDAGACLGDTALAFAASAGPQGRVYAFDIMPAHLEVIRANLASNPALGQRIQAVEAALSESSDEALYIHGNGPSARVEATPSDQRVEVITIDEFVVRQQLPRVDFIKMDIEGAEGPALRGAAQTIKRYKPKLAISLYHHPTDICDLPLLIDAMGTDYAYHLDHYTIHTEETVLYAIPRR